MAKLQGPLFSLGASGAIAKTLVYFGWKGLDVVRSYVVPSNPKTSGQTTQRGYLTQAVAAIHGGMAEAAQPLNETDQMAFAALAQAKGKVMTWFNMAVKLMVDCRVAGDGPVLYRNGIMSDTDKDDFRPYILFDEVTADLVADGKFYLGTSKTNLVTPKVATIIAGVSATLGAAAGYDGLTAGTKYYWQFRPDAGDPCVGADTGIYYSVAT